ncbi:unnamed protein product [Caenorhabditis auriculariae]|uniref:Uncharacterized protein n=1 Tax=Caenorhabditis auriculariae TaxID=2777116 RepID=A0A8S1GMA8_9PELO|nr:unnamed protein product [Caenorhabditis auriculariae]
MSVCELRNSLGATPVAAMSFELVNSAVSVRLSINDEQGKEPGKCASWRADATDDVALPQATSPAPSHDYTYRWLYLAKRAADKVT